MKPSLLAAATACLLAAPGAAESFPHSGAPKWEFGDDWTLKLRGRLNYDLGWIERPDGVTRDDLGWEDEVRRLRLGFELEGPSGFGAKFETDFAGTVEEGDSIEITDAILTYKASKALKISLGQHNNFQSLEELTSSRFTSFVERAAFTDAFGFERRVGLSADYKQGDLIVSAGVFTDNMQEFDDNPGTPVGGDARIVYAPRLGDAQGHFGASFHYSDLDVPGGDNLRYRQRPQTHPTGARFVATQRFPVSSETSYGAEAALISGPLHIAGEVHWLRPAAVGAPDPTFFGGYAEAGYFLTGETRGYKSGKFDRTSPDSSLGKGGFGALQLNARYDHLDLSDAGIVGGTQDALLASLIWIPAKHLRFAANYGRIDFDNAAIAAAGGDTDYSIDVAGLRFQFDF